MAAGRYKTIGGDTGTYSEQVPATESKPAGAYRPIPAPTTDSQLFPIDVSGAVRQAGRLRAGESESDVFGIQAPSAKNKIDASLGRIDAAATEERSGPTKADFQTVQAALGATVQATDNLHRDEFYTDTEKWRQEGKYWFDPKAELKPDLDAFLAKMPSEVENLRSSSFNTDNKNVGTGLLNTSINPASFKVDNKVVSNVLNPLNLADEVMGEGFASYVGSRAAKGAMSSGFVGAAIGIIEGIFGWSAAQDADKKAKQQARDEYLIQVKEWERSQRERNQAVREQASANAQARAEKRLAEAKTKEAQDKAKRDLRIAANRERMKAALVGAGDLNQAARESRIKRWS
jgi:hypothetical protein